MKFKFDQIAINSTAKKKPEPKDAANYVGLEHLTPGTFEISEWGSNVAPVGEKLLMKKGDVLFGRRRAYQRKVGIAPFDGIFSAHGMVLRPRAEVVDESYFPFFISSDQFMNEAVRISVGSLSPTINWGTLKNCEFDLPPMDEQKKLAELLWAANDLKEKYKKAITATDEMLKAKFREMFGEKSEFPYVSLISVCRPRQWPTISTKDFTETGFPVYGANGQIGRYTKYNHLNPTVLIACRGASCGAINISVEKSYINGNAMALDDLNIEKYEFKYFAYLLKEYDFQHIIGGSAQPQITRDGLSQVFIPLPPLALQREFVAIAEKAEAAKTALKKSIADIDQVMKGLING